MNKLVSGSMVFVVLFVWAGIYALLGFLLAFGIFYTLAYLLNKGAQLWQWMKTQ